MWMCRDGDDTQEQGIQVQYTLLRILGRIRSRLHCPRRRDVCSVWVCAPCTIASTYSDCHHLGHDVCTCSVHSECTIHGQDPNTRPHIPRHTHGPPPLQTWAHMTQDTDPYVQTDDHLASNLFSILREAISSKRMNDAHDSIEQSMNNVCRILGNRCDGSNLVNLFTFAICNPNPKQKSYLQLMASLLILEKA